MAGIGLTRRLALAALLSSEFSRPARAQSKTMTGPPAIIVVGAGPMNFAPMGLLQGLEEHRLVTGRDFTIRFEPEVAGFTASLRRAPGNLIFAVGSLGVHAARSATTSLPIVAVDLESEPLAEGLIARFGRPGGNLTGMFLDQPGLATKWLQYLTDTVPGLQRLAVLRQPTSAIGQWRAVQAQAGRYKLLTTLFEFEAGTLEQAFSQIVEFRPQALMILSSPLVVSSRSRIAALAAVAGLPSITMFRVYAESGGLMAFGPDPMTMGHRSASYVARILRGVSPADLPIEQPSRFELAVNIRTARSLGVTVPQSIMVAADGVFE